ncbi:MAG: glycosyltransferase, partial [Acidobacteriota bacterium]|nr:glycosyltransferase [Acidobacteriota bacterium]
VPRYQLYLSFTGGPTLDRIQRQYGSPCAKALYCSVDPSIYHPEASAPEWDLGYLGTYSDDRQPALDKLLLEPAQCWPEGRFVVAGPLYPESITWPRNVARIEHLSPADHRAFYNTQRFTLNVTRKEMARAGYSPSVRLFEAAACGVPILSDYWEGLDTFFEIGREILVVHSPEETLRYVTGMAREQRLELGSRACERVLAKHTSAHRAAELEAYARDIIERRSHKFYDNVSVDPARGHRNGRTRDLGLAAGNPPDCGGATTGGAARASNNAAAEKEKPYGHI